MKARNALEAIKSFAPMLSRVLRERSRIVCMLAFSMSFEICERAKRVGRVLVTVVQPRQTENGDVWTSNLERVCPDVPRLVGF